MKRYVIEHKTASSKSSIEKGTTYWKRLALDSQCSNYIMASVSVGTQADGVLYDVIRKIGLRPYEATAKESRKYTKEGVLYKGQRDKAETIFEYEERVKQEVEESPEKYFQRGVVVRLDNEIFEAASDNWITGQHVRDSQNSKQWPRNVDACERYGRFCDYWVVCSGEAVISNNLLFETRDTHQELEAIPDDGKKRLPLLTTSSMKAYRRCQREYYYSYELGRRSRESTAEALVYGTAFHKGLEVWWSTVDIEASVNAMLLAMGELDPWERVKAEALLRGYDKRWRSEPYRVVFVEKEFRMPLVNPTTGQSSRTWELGGKLDALAEIESSAKETNGYLDAY